MSEKYKKKEDGELSGEDDDYKSSNKQRKSDRDDRKKSKKSSRSQSSRRANDKTTNDSTKSSKKDKEHKESSRRRSSKSRSKDRKEQSKRKHSRSRSRSYHNDRNSSTNPKKDKDRDSGKDKDRKRSKSPTKDKDKEKDRKKDDRKKSKSPKGSSNNNGKRKSSRSKSPKKEESRRDKDAKSSYKDERRYNKDRDSRRSEENERKETRQLTLEEEEEKNDRYYNDFDDSDSGYYQRVNDRKQKSSRRSRSKSNKRDRRRSNSKKRDRDTDKNRSTTNGDSSKNKKESKGETSSKKQPEPKTAVVDQEEDFDDMDIEVDSEDERERKRKEFLIKVQGMQKPQENIYSNTNIENKLSSSANKKQDKSSDENEKREDDVQKNIAETFAEENSDDQFENFGINANDQLDDDELDNNEENQVKDDYIPDANDNLGLTQRHSFDKAQMEYLKQVEDKRDQEIKGGIPDEPEPTLQEKRRSISKELLERKFSNKTSDEYDETNRRHKLDEDQDSEEETDMFGDNIDKMLDPSKDDKFYGVKNANAECDDEQNYFKILIGDLLGGKYRVVSKCGKGVFANVCKAEQLDNGKMVAIKILRSNEIMHESGEREKEIVNKLNMADKNDRKHIVRLKNVFEHQKHICLVFECFAMNLRDAMKEYGKGKGFSLDVVRSYAYQIFVALTHLKKNNIIHADLKPDNLLISEDTKTLKMCDFGTALSVEENGIIKYIQSRFYRAPEVLIGYPPYNQIDVWSIGVTLYEIYTQKILFDGSTNNEMLKLIMDARGKFNKKMLQSGQFVTENFDQNFVFKYMQIDPQTKQKYITPITYGDIPRKDISKQLQENKNEIHLENQKKLSQFKDFLDKCLQLDPKNRITPEDALKHPFLDLNTAKPK